tara:strand:- start:2801 stop:2986 length:186 start_codon:yes stop_codon:yes gene_type:complete
MTTESNVSINMQDVDVVRAAPESPPATRIDRELWIAGVSRMRAEMTQNIEKEATEKKNAKR